MSPEPPYPSDDSTRAPDTTARHLIGAQPGDTIGPYRLLQVIGEGGFGVVYLAERRDHITQRVALKVIKPGMDSKSVIARFEQERQALAVMDHPNVAKVFDAGATDRGLPYFVMEYVKGEPITSYCDRHTLTLRQRLELFIPVCEAVQHAHHKGIIHRDLKPANILITVHDGKPIPKVIDFGIAKAVAHTLTDKTIFTETGQFIGTPEYISPEQAEMSHLDIDTRTDVYSLGVVLYELLTGVLPFDPRTLRAAGYHEIQRIIREVDPPKPSTRLSTADDKQSRSIALQRRASRDEIARLLRRELEWIPLKALRKDRTERYDTPSSLAEDIERYLHGEPLDAGPESAAYRVRKFLRRYRGPVTAAAFVLFALTLGLVASLWQAERASREADAARQAESRANDERQRAIEQTAIAEVAVREAEFKAYIANLTAAQASLASNEPARVRARLDACPAHLRNWEWMWLNAESDKSLLLLDGLTNQIHGISFSPDSSRLASASINSTAGVWDAESGEELALLQGHAVWVIFTAFSPDGSRIVTASNDHTARVWDAATGESLVELKGHMNGVWSAAFSQNGSRIVSASWDNTVRVWDAATGESLAELKGHTHEVNSATFSPDGARIVTGSRDNIVTGSRDNIARVWDAATGVSLTELKGHTHEVSFASFSPDGTRIVTTSFIEDTTRVWDAATGESLVELKGETDWVIPAIFSPDGSRIVTMSHDGSGRVWDAVTGESIAELKGHRGGVYSVKFSQDGSRIITASQDGTARVWDPATGASLAELKGHTNQVYFASITSDGSRIVTASLDGTSRVWDATALETLAQLTIHQRGDHAAFSPDGTRLVTASDESIVRVWDATTGASLVELMGHADWVNSSTFSPDGMRIVTASDDTTARVWDARTGETLAELKGHTGGVYYATFSPDGTRIVTASDDTTARVWDGSTGAFLAELKGHANHVNSAAFSPDGTRIVTTACDGTARIWDAANGEELEILRRHTDMVWSATFSPDGTRIVTVSDDGTARIWDSIPYRIRYAERRANERAEDGSAIVRAWLKAVREGTEKDFKVDLR